MGRRSRRRDALGSEADRPARLRGEARAEQIRASLEPLEEGQRPGAVTIAAILALVMAAANVVAAIAGADLRTDENEDSATTFTVISTGLLLLAAGGMWRAKYWAVLGFQAILAFQVIVLAVALIRVEAWYYAVGVVVVIWLLGWLFWRLVRAMARIQMPQR